MAGPWSSGFSFGFGPLNALAFPISGKDPSLMAVLGFSSTETLFYDFSDRESFYVLVKPPEIVKQTLFSVPPSFASQWFQLVNSTVVYNPFQGNTRPRSTVI